MNAVAEQKDTAESLIAMLEQASDPTNTVYYLGVNDVRRLVAYLRRPAGEVVDAAVAKLQVDVPLQVRDKMVELLAKLPEDERPVVGSIIFGTSHYENGWFFVDRPNLQLFDGADLGPEVTWYQVFGDDGPENLHEFIGVLSDIFGPLDSSSELEIDMETGLAMDPGQ